MIGKFNLNCNSVCQVRGGPWWRSNVDYYCCFIIHVKGLQQCVGAKNGTAISNPVLHRDCRSISGSADNQGNGPSGYAQNAPNSFGGPVPVFPNTGQASPATLTGLNSIILAIVCVFHSKYFVRGYIQCLSLLICLAVCFAGQIGYYLTLAYRIKIRCIDAMQRKNVC